MPFGIGPLELIIVLVIALVVLGPKRLPDLGRSLGTGMREFKDSITGKDDDDKTSLPASADEPQSSSEPATSEQHDDAISRPRG
jgi:sec-independent protein translocase protein TatA